MLVALKTRLFIRAFIGIPGLLARLFLFHILFLSSVVPDRVLSVHETGRLRGSDSLARQDGYLFEVIFLNYRNIESPHLGDLGAKRIIRAAQTV